MGQLALVIEMVAAVVVCIMAEAEAEFLDIHMEEHRHLCCIH